MKFLVLVPKGDHAVEVMLRSDQDEVKDPFESWALKEGKSVEFVTLQLAKMFKQFYLYGTFETKAAYGLCYDEMLAMLRNRLGPSDRDRYLELLQVRDEVQSKISSNKGKFPWAMFIEQSGLLLLRILFGAMKFVVVQVITLIVILFIARRK